MMTVAQVAAFFGCRPETIYRSKALQRRLSFKKLPGIGLRAPRQVVENVAGIPKEQS